MAQKHTPLDALAALGFGSDRVAEKIGWRGTYPKPSTDAHFRCEFCEAEHIDCTEIDHSAKCPVTIARAKATPSDGRRA